MADQEKPTSQRPASPSQRGAGPTPPRPAAAAAVRPATWMETHGRDLKFLVIFAALMGVYYLATTTSLLKDRFFPWYLDVNTQASLAVLKTVGYADLNRTGNTLHSKTASITVERGCDAVEPSALFAAAVLASPVVFSSRLIAVVVGVSILMIINLVRIISLYLTAVHWRSAFDVMHLDVWQAVFIFLAIFLWALWASWAVQRQRRSTNAVSNAPVA